LPPFAPVNRPAGSRTYAPARSADYGIAWFGRRRRWRRLVHRRGGLGIPQRVP